jgi:hypothetical protein
MKKITIVKSVYNQVETCCFSLFTVTVIILLNVSCGNRNHEKSDNLNDAAYTMNINVSNLYTLSGDRFLSASPIVLETNKESLIGTIDKLYLTDSLIIIFDGKQMCIFVFDIQGKYIRRIGEKGNGPGEYIELNDVFYDAANKQILAHERYKNKIYTYNLHGELMSQSKVAKFHFDSFCRTNEGYWIYTWDHPDGYQLILLDEDLQNVKAACFPQKDFFPGNMHASQFSCDENGIPYFFFPPCNYVYQLSGTEALPFIEVDFGERTMPYQRIATMDHNAYESLTANKRYLGSITGFKVNNGKGYFSFQESGYNIAVNSYNCLFDIKTDDIFVYGNPFIDKYKYPIASTVKQIWKDKFVFMLDLAIFSDNSFSVLKEDFSTDINAESNPILYVVEIK